jgi:uncharacterized RDD family membrane protein YckC
VIRSAAATGESPRVFASLGARFVAGLIDVAVITVPSLIISRVLERAPYRLADAAVTVLASAYFILSYSEAGGGYSIGKMALGIRVVNRMGEPLSLVEAAVRWFMSIGIALPLAFLAIGFERGTPVQPGPAFVIGVPILCIVIIDSYMCAANAVSHQSLHDVCAGSFVVRRSHTGEVPAVAPLARGHYIGMALCCLAIAVWFSRVYPWARAVGQRSVELMKARAIAIATGKAGSLILAPGFAAQGSDTAWVVSALVTIHAKPTTEYEAESLRKSLACLLAREAPLAFRGAELDMITTFDAGARQTPPNSVYMADIELTPEACNRK